MLRRFEIYSLRASAPREAVAALRRALRDCGRFIPEVERSAVGTNLSRTPLHLAWEHVYRSPEAYRIYMEHPFHAAVLDRYLLADSPERIVSDNGLGAGLVGYAVDGTLPDDSAGARRLILLELAHTGDEDAVRTLARQAGDVLARWPGMTASRLVENTFGSRWFDGVTPIGVAPAWTHLWEQGFRSRADLEHASGSDELLADARRADLVRRTLELEYELERTPADAASHTER
jgi:hypothetical protein